LFINDVFGTRLKELLRPLYYISASFIENQFAKEEMMKLGPELMENLQQIKQEIIERQKKYYP
jgi:hypothetical protein